VKQQETADQAEPVTEASEECAVEFRDVTLMEKALEALETVTRHAAILVCRLIGHRDIWFTDRYWQPNGICQRCQRPVYTNDQLKERARGNGLSS